MDNNNNNNSNSNSNGNSNNSNNKHQGMVVVIALIAAASLLSLGAVAATIITPAFADGHNDDSGTEKNIDELIIINKDEQPLTQDGLLQLLTEQSTKPQPAAEEQPTRTVGEDSTVGTTGFSAPSLP